MNIATRTIVGFCAALAVLAPTAVTATAAQAQTQAQTHAVSARAKHFGVIFTFEKAKLDACKISARKGTVWKIFVRLDTRKVKKGKYAGTVFVAKKGKDAPVDLWQSKLTSKGKLSAVGSVVLPRKAGYTLNRGIGAMNYGDGGPIKVAKIGTC